MGQKNQCVYSVAHTAFSSKKIFLKGRKEKKMKVTLGYILGLSSSQKDNFWV